MARNRQQVPKSPAPHNGYGRPSNGDPSPRDGAYLEAMLELIGRQTVEMQRLAALAAKSSAKSSPDSAPRPKGTR